jgi:spore coat polysaccharide biosynthesis protein SpsF (cytidylyltransferase family)
MLGAIIQARMGSTRLPQKVVKKIEGKTILEHIIERTKRIKNCKKVILAIPDTRENNVLEKIGKKCNISVFRGSEDDVLDRYYQAAKLFKIDSIVRITADCPLIDPEIAEKVINLYFKGNYDYVSNTYSPTFPDGMDVEIFNFVSLEKSWKEAKLKSEREHVTAYIVKNPKIFKIGNFENNEDLSYIRLTLDEKEDLILIRKIYKNLYNRNSFFGLKEILKLLRKKPELIKINQHIKRNEGYLKSLREDKIYEK